jgi:hypothetical protein
VIRAFAARTASVRVDSAFGRNAAGSTVSSVPGKGGSNGAGIVALRSIGCIVIGPVGRRARFFIPVKRSSAELVSMSRRRNSDGALKTPEMKGSITSVEYAVPADATYAPATACFTGERV